MNKEFYDNERFGIDNEGGPLYYGNVEQDQTVRQKASFASMMKYEPFMENALQMIEPAKVKVHISVPGSTELADKFFQGVLESSGRDYIIVSEMDTGHIIMIPIPYIVFIDFEENILKYLQK